ncbi:hypothetical protein HDU98_004802 [Podochytrium sp. JEL0797]|nr:hypothetical protein HDU98_004802 [Podochytrium sp. JEL0797]
MPSSQTEATEEPHNIWDDPDFVQWRHDHYVNIYIRYDAPEGQFFSEKMPERLMGVMDPKIFSARIHEINDHLATYSSYTLADYAPNFNTIWFIFFLFWWAVLHWKVEALSDYVTLLFWAVLAFAGITGARKNALKYFMAGRMSEFSRLDKEERITWSSFQYVRILIASLDWREETVRVSWAITIYVEGKMLKNVEVEA